MILKGTWLIFVVEKRFKLCEKGYFVVDIYFQPNYGKLYEKMENGTCEVFEYQSSLGQIHHMFIKREIPIKVDGKTYYDLITPYGYGGPLIQDCKEGSRKELAREFATEFRSYCIDNNIVSEFVRFHPIVGNAEDFNDCYHVEHVRNTVGTNLQDYEDPVQDEFSKSCRKRVRKALRDGISYQVIETPSSINGFRDIYYSTMDRNAASEFYYFDNAYFDKCLELFKENLLLVEAMYGGQVIAMGLYFIHRKTIHIHLSGTLNEFLRLSPAYILRYGVTLWGKENGYELIHHGGGRTDDPDDGLYRFKKQFGQNTEFKFCVGKKIWDMNVYKQLSSAMNIDKQVDFFPAYRS